MSKPLRLIFAKNGVKTTISARNGTGELKTRVSSKFTTESEFTKAAEELGVAVAALKAAVDAYERAGTSEVDLGQKDYVVWLRPIRDLASTSIAFRAETLLGALGEALDAKDLDIVEPVLYWDDIHEMAALDLDAVPGYEFDDMRLLALEGIPTSAYSWTTKSGGLRLIYVRQDTLTAEEIAAVAYLCLMQTTPYRSLEVKKESRHPAYITESGESCGVVLKRQQDFNPSYLRRWLQMYSASDAEAQAWLAERGMVIGQRYGHDKCPGDPTHESKGQNPVLVGEKGVTCFSCQARGVVSGSQVSGFFPYSSLCGSTAASIAYRCFSHATHWEHAKFIVEAKLELTGHYAALIYSAGLALHGWSRDVINRVFSAGKDLVRMNDRWTNLNGSMYSKDIKPILAKLPAGSNITPDKIVADRAKVAVLDQTFDLSSYGYPSIHPVYGMKIHGYYIKGRDRDITAVVQTRELSDPSMMKFRPFFRPVVRRMSNAWGIVESVFPGVDHNYIKLLIAARGVIEGGMSTLPITFVTGPTSAGKSNSITLAASMCGDRNTEIVWSSDSTRIRQAIIDANGSYVTFNEILKEAKQTKGSGLDFLLNLTPDSVSHALYVGPVRMGRLPAFILTDTEIPQSVKEDGQLARRIVHVHLTSAVDWEPTIKDSNIGDPSRFRLHSENYAEACNTIVSEVIDEFFQYPSNFEEIANQLGFYRLSKSDEADEGRHNLLRFFQLLCKAPELPAEEAIRFRGRGWKLIRRDLETELRNVWLGICDKDGQNELFTSSRKCSEQDWMKVIGAKEPVVFELRAHGSTKIVVRFRNAAGSRTSYKVNEELL